MSNRRPAIDITVPIRAGMPVFEGDPQVRIGMVARLAEGGVCNLSEASMGLHTGTHIDAPNHFIDGAAGVEGIDLDACIGRCLLVDCAAIPGHIEAADIRTLVPEGTERVVLRTGNGRLWEADSFDPGYTALTVEAATELVARGVRLVGIDYLSVAPFDDPAPVHVALLRAGVVILEGLDLRHVAPGEYSLTCLPLLVPGADGAPARALLHPL